MPDSKSRSPRSQMRVEQTIRCPRDGRAVARVLVSAFGRHLELTKARLGQRAALIEETREQLDAAEQRLADEPDGEIGGVPNARLVERLRAAVDELTSEDIWVEEDPEPIPSEMDLGFHALGMSSMPRLAACPRCHAKFELRVSIDAYGRCTVVVS